MGTTAVIGYYDDNNNYRATMVSSGGNPRTMIPNLERRISEEGYSYFKEWVETGIAQYGHYSINSEINPDLTDDDYPGQNCPFVGEENYDNKDFGYVLYPHGALEAYSWDGKLIEVSSISMPDATPFPHAPKVSKREARKRRGTNRKCSIKHKNARTAQGCPVCKSRTY